MSLSFSSTTGHEIMTLVSPLSYRDVISADEPRGEMQQADVLASEKICDVQISLSPQELEQLLSVARLEATADAERRLRAEFEAKLTEEGAQLRQSVDEFVAQKKEYLSRVEGEVIRLALAIAAKILHREAQADPMLIAAMVRIALDKLQERSSVSIRVPVAEVERWKDSMTPPPHGVKVEVIGDSQLGQNHCILQAELGTVDFSIDSQLKEVEQGFFDLLAQRPAL